MTARERTGANGTGSGRASPGKLKPLRGDAAFRSVKRGRVGSVSLLSVRWIPDGEATLVGIVVSKRVGKAVTRNRVRRRIREVLRRLDLPPARIMVIARPEAAEAGSADLASALRRACTRAGLLA